MKFKNGIEAKNYLDYLLSDKVKDWDDMSPLEQLIIYRKSQSIIPSCENCDEVMNQYERYQFCKDYDLRKHVRETRNANCNELRNEEDFTMVAGLMNDPWRIVKAFALFESNAADADGFFGNDFVNWCDIINQAYREDSLTDDILLKMLMHNIYNVKNEEKTMHEIIGWLSISRKFSSGRFFWNKSNMHKILTTCSI